MMSASLAPLLSPRAGTWTTSSYIRYRRHTMSHVRALSLSVALPALALSLSACNERTLEAAPVSVRQYGVAQKIGNGSVRTYVVLDPKNSATPLEVGVALSEQAMDGLPAAGASQSMPGMNMTMLQLAMPSNNPTPYQWVQFD